MISRYDKKYLESIFINYKNMDDDDKYILVNGNGRFNIHSPVYGFYT